MRNKKNKELNGPSTKDLFRGKTLNTFYLKSFRREANDLYQVWKKNDNYLVAVDVFEYMKRFYAEETINFGDDIVGAKEKCDELRYNYILNQVKRHKCNKKVY